ncbi:hypothetical protein RchiOBHm_Chr7g0239941 [Rosa chinensis]|uniref:Uncharacterized protein n=1 Tax=Rosa chinensis TaxID=74649 RepID=A0A2P6PHV7_ROSCH|nr:hypothetical protein RchiOBHm_Chr7g0239941 [Rosa chinensis]
MNIYIMPLFCTIWVEFKWQPSLLLFLPYNAFLVIYTLPSKEHLVRASILH